MALFAVSREYGGGKGVVVPRRRRAARSDAVPVRLWAPRALRWWDRRRIWVAGLRASLASKPVLLRVTVGAPPGCGRGHRCGDRGCLRRRGRGGSCGEVPGCALHDGAGLAAAFLGVGVDVGGRVRGAGGGGRCRGGYRRAGERCSGRAVGALRLVVAGIGELSPSLWVLASLVTGGKLLATATDHRGRSSAAVVRCLQSLRGRTERQTTWMTTWPRRSRYTAGR